MTKKNDKKNDLGATQPPPVSASEALTAALNAERERVRRLEQDLASEKNDKNELRLALEMKREQHRLAMRQIQSEQTQRVRAEDILRSEKDLISQRLLAEQAERSRIEEAMQAELQQREFANQLLDSAKSAHSSLEKRLTVGMREVDDLRAAAQAARDKSTRLEREVAAAAATNAELAAALENERNSRIDAMDALRSVRQERDDLIAARAEADVGRQKAEALSEASRQEVSEAREQLSAERTAHAALLHEFQAEKSEHAKTRDDVLVERSRKVALSNLLTGADVPVARRGLWARIVRRLSRSEFSLAIREIENSKLFDAPWYEKTYPDVSEAQMEAIAHYLLRGAFDGHNPSENFITEDYLAANPDVKAAGVNPLLHYVRWGRKELRRLKPGPVPAAQQGEDPTRQGQQSLVQKFRPSAPPMSFFQDMARDKAGTIRQPQVDVIVPVYRGYDDTLACLASVLTSRNSTAYELIVIDDCSPEPEVSTALEEIAGLGLITLLKNEQNLGFVGTVNRGMALHADRDVVLLNSDAMVFNDWLDRICAHAADGKVSSVTPFTNNGTICSYPLFCRDNNTELEISYEALDRLVASVNKGKAVDVPTGVGFCMFLSRAALNDVGLFDQETFGKGYGEENDFCMRARKRGWRDVHALDVFVFHSGETSFAQSASESKRKGLAALQAKHPDYDGIVRDYLALDPARSARIALDAARLFSRSPVQSILCFAHGMEGGIIKYLHDRAASLREYDCDVIVATPAAPGQCIARFDSLAAGLSLPNLEQIDLVRDVSAVKAALATLNTQKIEIHSTVGWSYRVLEAIQNLARECGISYSMMVHDYVPVCPQLRLVDHTGHYCGEKGIAQCQGCVIALRTEPRAIHPDLPERSPINIAGWRKAYQQLLTGAEEVLAPSSDTATRLNRYFPEIKIAVQPHVDHLASIPKIGPAPKSEKLRVAVIGAIGPHKGSRVLLNCARNARTRKLPLEFVVVGFSDIDDDLTLAGVVISGKYREDEVGDILRRQRPHVVFLPSVWPETYCYTLSIALAAALPTCVFDLGAPAERLRGRPNSLLLPIGLVDDPGAINDRLLRFGVGATAVAQAQ